jgi:hypothetical protein
MDRQLVSKLQYLETEAVYIGKSPTTKQPQHIYTQIYAIQFTIKIKISYKLKKNYLKDYYLLESDTVYSSSYSQMFSEDDSASIF